jgi:hypothetical protein
MIDQRPFFLEALTRVNNNTFPFSQHLKATCDPLSPLICTYVPLFEQFIGQQMVQLQDSISKHLDYTLICFPMGYLKSLMLTFYHVLA